jgi:hypothetical protein
LLKLIESGPTVTPPPLSVTLLALKVSGLIGLLNTNRTSALSPTFPDPFGGDVELAVNVVVSAAAAVVKDSALGESTDKGNPLTPWIPAPSRQLVTVFGTSSSRGLTCSSVPPFSKLTPVWNHVWFWLQVTVSGIRAVESKGWLKEKSITTFVGKPVTWLAGFVLIRTGAVALLFGAVVNEP